MFDRVCPPSDGNPGPVSQSALEIRTRNQSVARFRGIASDGDLHETCMRPWRFCTGSARHVADHQSMEADLDLGLLRWRTRHRPRTPTVEDRLIARMLGRWLDRELADPALAKRGAGLLSEAHAARAGQLTADSTRRSLARKLDRLAQRAENPLPLIAVLAARLRSPEPVDACGMARLNTLFGDRTGPCCAPGHPDALAAALHEASELLDDVSGSQRP
jgi:hypothetical protein